LPRDYAYIVARLRALEAAGPDPAWFERLVRTPLDSVRAVVKEHFRGFEDMESLDMFEEGLEHEKLAALELITGVLSEERTARFLRAGYDFDNLLHAWKSARLSKQPEFNPFGLAGLEAIQKAVDGNSITDLPDYLRKVHEGLQSFEGPEGIGTGSYYAERAKWEFLLEAAPSKRAGEYTRHCIDLSNIKAFMRFKRERLRSDRDGAAWIQGGEIEPWTLGHLLKEPGDEFYNFLSYTSYRSLISRGLGPGTPGWKADALLRLESMERMGDGKYGSFDIMPVIHHLEVLDLHGTMLRVIITGKLNRLPEEIINERVSVFLQ
jgi:V/A-type H+-transporting ATPase subunit C